MPTVLIFLESAAVISIFRYLQVPPPRSEVLIILVDLSFFLVANGRGSRSLRCAR